MRRFISLEDRMQIYPRHQRREVRRRHVEKCRILEGRLEGRLVEATRVHENLLALDDEASATDVEVALLFREDAYRAYKAVAPPTVIELWYFLRELFLELVLIIKRMVRPVFKSRECRTAICTLLTKSGTGWCSSCRTDYGRVHYPAVLFYGCGKGSCNFRCSECKQCECRDDVKEWGTMGTCKWCA